MTTSVRAASIPALDYALLARWIGHMLRAGIGLYVSAVVLAHVWPGVS